MGLVRGWLDVSCTCERSVWLGLVALIVNLELRTQKQDAEFKASLKYIVRPCLKTTKKQKRSFQKPHETD